MQLIAFALREKQQCLLTFKGFLTLYTSDTHGEGTLIVVKLNVTIS